MGFRQLWARFRAWQKGPVCFKIRSAGGHRCANCGNEFEGNYCPVCRQDAGDGRITWRWVYECVMTVWGMDSRSLPHTLLQLLLRPGYLIGDYISGRRQVSYTPVNMLFIVALVYVVVKQLSGIAIEPAVAEVDTQYDFINKSNDWLAAHPGWGAMFMTMILILPTRYLFRFAPRHTRHTLPEGIMIQVYMSTLMLILLLFMWFFKYVVLLVPFYYVVAYRQLFGYSVWGTLWRTLLCVVVWVMVFFSIVVLMTLVNGDLAMEYNGDTVLAVFIIATFLLFSAVAITAIGYFIGRHGYKKRQAAG
jgi:hypothetical protein